MIRGIDRCLVVVDIPFGYYQSNSDIALASAVRIMKKSGLFLLIVLVFALNIHAQFRVALAGGINSSSVKETNELPGWDSIRHNYSSRTGAHFGFIADLRLAPESKFYFQPGVFFYNKGRKYESPYDSNATIQTYSYSQFINYMDMVFLILLSQERT